MASLLRSLGLAFVFLVLLNAVVHAEATAIPVDASSKWLHKPSGFEFPPNVGRYLRGEIDRYDDAGQDVSAGYNQIAPYIAMTVYVYPARGFSLERNLEWVKAEIVHEHPDAKLVASGTWTLKQADRQFSGYKAIYSISTDFAGQQQEVLSHLYMFKLGDFLVKYRVTYPAGVNEIAVKQIAEFLSALHIP